MSSPKCPSFVGSTVPYMLCLYVYIHVYGTHACTVGSTNFSSHAGYPSRRTNNPIFHCSTITTSPQHVLIIVLSQHYVCMTYIAQCYLPDFVVGVSLDTSDNYLQSSTRFVGFEQLILPVLETLFLWTNLMDSLVYKLAKSCTDLPSLTC